MRREQVPMHSRASQHSGGRRRNNFSSSCLRQDDTDELIQIHGSLMMQFTSRIRIARTKQRPGLRTSFSTSVSLTTSIICSSVNTSPYCKATAWACHHEVERAAAANEPASRMPPGFWGPPCLAVLQEQRPEEARVTCYGGGRLMTNERTSNAALSSCMILDSCFFL